MHPRPAATVILVRDPFEVLMVRRNPEIVFMGGFWVFPGGKVEASDSSPEDAARRELTEEAAITLAEDAEMIPYARWITPLGPTKRYDTLFFLADASAVVDGANGLVPTADGSEIVEARWIAPQIALGDGSVLALPTRTQLERLAGFSERDALFAASRGLTVSAILPEIVDGRPTIVKPEG